MTSESWLDSVKSCLREVDEPGRLFPNGKRIEVVFTVEATNLLLLRTEGPGDINEATLPETGISVPIIQPQKLMAVVRRRMLQILRAHRDAGADLSKYIKEAADLGFEKAKIHLEKGWNCTIQPPLAERGGGERLTDIGMDGYCPSCTIFGAALTQAQFSAASGNMSIGIKSRVHFDPAFAIARMIQPETHNKVTEGHISTTGGALFSEIHVMPGTIFIGRVVLHDVTEPELLATLYSLATIEEIGGRSGVYGTIRVRLLGVRCGNHSVSTALELADEIAGQGIAKPSEIINHLEKKLQDLGFTLLGNEDDTGRVDPSDPEGVIKDLWESSISYVKQLHKLITEMRSGGQQQGRRGRGSRAG